MALPVEPRVSVRLSPTPRLIESLKRLESRGYDSAGVAGVVDGHVVGVEPGLKGRRLVQGNGRKLVPGFLDAHVHVESSLMVPRHFARAVLPRGTTTAICDPHELTNVIGVEGLRYFLEAAETLPLCWRVARVVRSTVGSRVAPAMRSWPSAWRKGS